MATELEAAQEANSRSGGINAPIFIMYNIFFNSQISKNTETKITSIIDNVAKNFEQLLGPIDNLDIYISIATPQTSGVSPAVSAITYETGLIILEFANDDIDALEIYSTLFHELNHHYRNQIFSTEEHPTLFNWSLLEGIAINFESFAMKYFYNSPIINPNISNCSDEELQSGLAKMLEVDKSNLYWNHYDWFYNFDQLAPYPVNFAYQIATWLVSLYCEANNISPVDASKIPNRMFLNFANQLCA